MESYGIVTVALILALLAIGVILWFVSKNRLKTSVVKESDGGYHFRDFARNETLKRLYPMLAGLEKVDKTNPSQRPRNLYDVWFEKNVERFAVNGWYLAFIENYGYLTETFLNKLYESDKNIVFQKLLISVNVYNFLGICIYQENFGNLLLSYSKRWKLLPEIEEILEKDKRFAQSKATYELGRRIARSY